MKPKTLFVRVASPLVFALLVAACGGGGGGTSSQPIMCFGSSVTASETNNYAFSSTITLAPVKVAQMSNLTFDWSGLSKDFLGRQLNPATDLGAAIVMIWDLKLADFEAALNADALYPADLVVSPPLNLPLSGQTSGKLYDFLVNGTPVTPDMFNTYFDASLYPSSNTTFLVGVQAGTDLGREIRMLQAFDVDASSNTTNVSLSDTSTKLTYSADLHSLTVTGVPGGTASLTLDWSQMKKNALGATFSEGYVTSAIVGHYSQSVSQLEGDFLNLDRIALKTYRADIAAGSTLDFTTLKDDSGASFAGVTDDGTWLVGLVCGNCRNPAPWYMTILKPCSM